jgi:hypothetical protein
LLESFIPFEVEPLSTQAPSQAQDMKAMWHRIRFFPEEVAQGKHRQLRNAILKIYNQKDRPADVALFSTPLLSTGEIHLYFSPAAWEGYSRYARTYRLRPCDKPDFEEVKLVLGRPGEAVLLLDEG